jgi:hypothetical protein
LPGGLGRPSPPWLSRGEILKAVCQDTQRLSERRDTILESEHAPVQGGLRFLVTPTGMHAHGTPPSADNAGHWHEAGGLCLLLSFIQDTTTGPAW